MIAVDTSVVVAAFASWHEGHEAARRVLAAGPRVPAHVLVETYSVLTRLPPPHRVLPAVAASWLAQTFGTAPLVLPAAAHVELIGKAAAAGIAGGGVHDALIAATVLHARGRLVTRDRRAAPIYERIGVEYELVT